MKPAINPTPQELLPTGVAQLPSPWAHTLHKPVFIAFLVLFALMWVTLLLGISLAAAQRWAEGAFWLLAAITSLVGVARRLPEQNVLMSATIITGVSFVIALVGERTGVPFGPRIYTDDLGAKVLGVPWPLPLIWIVVMVSCRGVARLIMRPWRKTTYYGFWVIGLSCLLAVLFDLGFEPFATRAKHYWLWQTHATVLNWYSTPWVNFLGWFATAIAILGFTTPWLINKQPIKLPTDYHPLVMWLLLGAYSATGSALHHMWVAVSFSIVASSIVTIYALRGARW
jgi:putative membrane protein